MNADATYLKQFCESHPACIIKENKETLFLVVMSPITQAVIEQLTFTCQKKINIDIVPETKFIEHCQVRSPALFHAQAVSEDAPSIIESCQAILSQAIQQKASDIHIEPHATGAKIRFRIDGVLHRHGEITSKEMSAIESRFKLLAGVDIAENRRPQDGQLTFHYHDAEYSFRLATLPTRFGEKVVLRLLETFRGELLLENLGLPPQQLSMIKEALDHPQGLIIVTGPTGSGKTTTLYSALTYLNRPERNLCSVEDPIELVIAGINQTQINIKAGLDFPTILRALLRQDPDILMIGEIRDNQTAEMAIKAAQTGHLVLSTLHTNSTVETLSRLTQMGIAEYLIAGSVKLIIAQRLVRRLCAHCRALAPQPLSLGPPLTPCKHWFATGCQQCISGYIGRHALFELLPIDSAIQNTIIDHRRTQKIRYLLQERKIQSLYEAGLSAVAQGITSYQELLRVIGKNDAAT